MTVDARPHPRGAAGRGRRRAAGWHKFTAPGWWRVLWTTPLSFLLATALVAGGRAALGYPDLAAPGRLDHGA